MENKEERDQTTWNLSEYKINIIGGLMQRATNEFLNGKTKVSFECWKQIALVIDNRLETEEQTKLAELETNVYAKGTTYDKEEADPSERLKYTNLFNGLVMRYARYVNILLKKVGLDLKTRDNEEEDTD